MKVYVLSSRKFDGQSKNGKQMNGFFVEGVSQSGEEYKGFSKFISLRTSGGLVIEPGQVLNIFYNENGYVEECSLVPAMKCSLKIETVNGNNLGK